MLIYEIASNLHEWEPSLLPFGFEIKNIVPSAFSFFTSIRIATAAKTQTPEAIIVTTRRDAIAAVSARKLFRPYSPSKFCPILWFVDSDTKRTGRLSAELERELDAIVFDSEDSYRSWETVSMSDKLTRAIIHLPADASKYKLIKKQEVTNPETLRLGYVGPIKDGIRLKTILDDILQLPESKRPQLTVLGTARASIVMPLVKKAKHKGLNVIWKGEDYNLATELNALDAFVPSSPSLSAPEKILLEAGTPALPRINPLPDMNELENARKKSCDIYNNLYKPEKAAVKLQNLLSEIRAGSK